MVNKERIQLWVDALKSGDYEQTDGELQNKYGYCCLGVACKIAVDNGCVVKVEKSIGGIESVAYDESEGDLPESVKNWYGLEKSDPILKIYEGDTITATDLNDNLCLTFNEIADAIHEKFLV